MVEEPFKTRNDELNAYNVVNEHLFNNLTCFDPVRGLHQGYLFLKVHCKGPTHWFDGDSHTSKHVNHSQLIFKCLIHVPNKTTLYNKNCSRGGYTTSNYTTCRHVPIYGQICLSQCIEEICILTLFCSYLFQNFIIERMTFLWIKI